MITTSPKNSRNKRLHIVFFTDASKTKSTSISLRNLTIIGSLTAAFFSAAGMSLYLYRQNKNVIQAKEEYIRELKSAIISYAVTNEKNQLAMANEADPQTDITRKIAREIQFPTANEKKVASNQTDNTLANLQSSLSSLSTVSANLARNEKGEGKSQVSSFAKNNAEVKSAAGAVAAERTSPNSGGVTVGQTGYDSPSAVTTATGRPSGLLGVQVEPGHTTEVNGQTTVHFQLVNTSKNKAQSWTGRVCGVAELTNNASEQTRNGFSMSAKGQLSGFLSLPGGFRVDSAKSPSNGCADGELVRFSRLRPAELVIPAKQDVIKRVTIFFVESGSHRIITQPIEL